MIEYLTFQLLFLTLAIIIKLKHKIKIYKSKKEAIIFTLTILAIGIICDYLAIWRGYWNFGEVGLSGITIGALPIEEYTLFLFVPFFGLVFYKYLQQKINKKN